MTARHQPVGAHETATTTTAVGAVDVVRRGIRRTPDLRRALWFSVVLAVAATVGRLVIPVLVQQVLDRGLLGPDGYRPSVVWPAAGMALGVTAAVAVITPVAQAKMAKWANHALHDLRCQAFGHIHRLSLIALGDERQGRLLARVTSDIDAISQFVEWGAVQWSVNLTLIAGALVLMFSYSWQLAMIAGVCLLVAVPVLKRVQQKQLEAYGEVRDRVADLLGEFDEVLAGAASVRSYGFESAAEDRLEAAIVARYRADIRTARYYAVLFTIGDMAGALAIGAVAVAALTWGPEWGLAPGEVVSFFFLVTLIQGPIAELTEVIDHTQTAVAGWDKVLTLLETEPDLAEPDPGVGLPSGPLSVVFDQVDAAYGDTVVLHGVSLTIPAGTRVAVVGRTGSGKTTFARLVCRLMDPRAGTVRLGGVDLTQASPNARRHAVRLVPQDGFLFDATVADNVAYGREGADRGDVEAAVQRLGLGTWVAKLPRGLDTPVGPRGEQLSVGERQLVALLRATLANPGLLVLDEATSSVDPATEQALATAIERLAGERTLLSIAHRISTAERADVVLVFDRGCLVEAGPPAELEMAGGVYTGIVAAWRRTVGEPTGR